MSDFLNVLGGNDEQSKDISSFTERVQKGHEKLGGSAELAASRGSKVTQQLRLMAECQCDKEDDPFGVDLLRIQGKKAADILENS